MGTVLIECNCRGNILDCPACFGEGVVETEREGCICEAREPMECDCGGWDDVDIEQWYGDGLFP